MPYLKCRSGAEVTPLVLSGEVDQYRAESLQQELLTACGALDASTPLALDFQTVDHIDASGLQVLVSCGAAFPNRKLRIEGASESIRQWFRIAGAETLFEFSDSSR